MTVTLSRRAFLIHGAAGALTLGFALRGGTPLAAQAQEIEISTPGAEQAAFTPSAWLTVEPSGEVVIALHKSEMGQGVMTSLPMIVADELDADWMRVRVEPATGDPAFGSFGGNQFTFGSTSVSMSWDALRSAGATARAMLLAAAAQAWGVPVAECRTERGAVIHDGSNRRLDYGSLAGAAALLPVPDSVEPKDATAFTLIGQPLPRLDVPAKSDGSAAFAMDVSIPGMLTAVTLRPPVFGATIASYDASITMMIPGVKAVVEIPPVLPGVDVALAVVADGFWPAMQGREALRVQWTGGRTAGLTSATMDEQMRTLLAEPAPLAFATGDAMAAKTDAATMVEVDFEAPHLAHAAMEPLTCAAHVRADGVDVWSGTQAQTATVQLAAQIAGVSSEQVILHQYYLGGGFGRRAEVDYVADAVTVSKAVGAPVKVIWPRQEDMQHDFYRPGSMHRVRVGLDADGLPVAWEHRIAGDWIGGERFPMFLIAGPDGEMVDPNSVAALRADFSYPVPAIRVETVNAASGLPIGFWRGVGHSTNAWVIESVIDAAASTAGQDPLTYRRRLLVGNSRAVKVLDALAAAADWGAELAPGRGRGMAIVIYPGTIVATAIEVTAGPNGEITVDRAVVVADCGIVVNPDILTQQLEGGTLHGISAALAEEVTVRDGAVEQAGFDTYPILRFSQAPPVEVVIVSSEAPPGGVGEPPTVVAMPALSNAVWAATGIRPRRLPLRPYASDRA